MHISETDAARVQALEDKIHQMECELQKHYSQMGKSLLQTAEGEQRIINQLVDEIIEARAEMVQIKGQQECTECTAYNDPDSRYCKRCGARLDVQTAEKES